MRRLNRRVPPFFPRPTTCIPCPPSKAHKPTLFCPIFKQCIPLFYRRAHKCGKKGCKWGSNINLYYLIPATSSKPLLRALHGNTHNSHSGLWFLQGNAIQRNWQRNKYIRAEQITVNSSQLYWVVCLSPFNYLLIRQGWHLERNQTTVSSVTLYHLGQLLWKHTFEDAPVEKSLGRAGYCCVCESSAFNYPLIKQGWQEGEGRGHFLRQLCQNLQPFLMNHNTVHCSPILNLRYSSGNYAASLYHTKFYYSV